MADANPTDLESDPARPACEDTKVERVVLSFLLDKHPSQLTIPELSSALNADPNRFEANDAVERAVRELVGAGLLHCRGGFVLPTRAALCLAYLEMD